MTLTELSTHISVQQQDPCGHKGHVSRAEQSPECGKTPTRAYRFNQQVLYSSIRKCEATGISARRERTSYESDPQPRRHKNASHYRGSQHRCSTLPCSIISQPKCSATISAVAKGHKCSASQTATEPTVLRSHETMAPIIPGSAMAAFSASTFSQSARVFSCFFTHSAAPPGVALGAGVTPPPSAFWMASTMVDTIKPNAVRIDAMVTPCSRNNVHKRSASEASSLSIRAIVSRIRLNCVRRASRLAEALSSRAARSLCR